MWVKQVIPVANYQEWKSEHFFPLHLGITAAEKNTVESSTGYNNALLTEQEKKTSFSSGHPPWQVGPSGQLMQGYCPAHTPLVLQQKDPVPSLQRTDRVVELARCLMMHILKQDKGAHTESEAGKDALHKVVNPAQAGRTPSLGKEVLM